MTAIVATATTAALATAPAEAGPLTYTIQNGGYLTGTNMGPISAYGSRSGFAMNCTSSTFSGWTQKDTSGSPVVDGIVDGENIATLDDVSFSSPGANANDWCWSNGVYAQVTTLGLPWKFVATGSGPGGTTDGRLTGIQFKLHMQSSPCDVIIGGPGVGGSGGYYEAMYLNPSTLTSGDAILFIDFQGVSNLTVLSISGPSCEALYMPGEPVSLIGQYNLKRTGPVPPAAGISPTIT
ncbi:hypothetical protein ABZ806_20560 [Spirillospora sp. NPDC047418]